MKKCSEVKTQNGQYSLTIEFTTSDTSKTIWFNNIKNALLVKEIIEQDEKKDPIVNKNRNSEEMEQIIQMAIAIRRASSFGFELCGAIANDLFDDGYRSEKNVVVAIFKELEKRRLVTKVIHDGAVVYDFSSQYADMIEKYGVTDLVYEEYSLGGNSVKKKRWKK